MITTVTLNPSIDKSYIVNNFSANGNYSVDDVTVTVEGNGINVAKVASNLIDEIKATGFLGGPSGDYIQHELSNAGIKSSFVGIKDNSMYNTSIIDPINKTETTLNEQQPKISKSELTTFIKEYIKILKYSKIIVASGSVPGGVPKTIYRDIVKTAKDNNVIPIIDATGEYLEEAIKAKPYMIKSTIDELKKMVGYNLKNELEIIHEARFICKQGVEIVVIPYKTNSYIFATKSMVYKGIIDESYLEDIKSDEALLAGFSVALIKGLPLEEAIRYSCSCAFFNPEINNIDKIVNNKTVKVLKMR